MSLLYKPEFTWKWNHSILDICFEFDSLHCSPRCDISGLPDLDNNTINDFASLVNARNHRSSIPNITGDQALLFRVSPGNLPQPGHHCVISPRKCHRRSPTRRDGFNPVRSVVCPKQGTGATPSGAKGSATGAASPKVAGASCSRRGAQESTPSVASPGGTGSTPSAVLHARASAWRDGHVRRSFSEGGFNPVRRVVSPKQETGATPSRASMHSARGKPN